MTQSFTAYVAVEITNGLPDKSLWGKWFIEKDGEHVHTANSREEVVQWLVKTLDADVILELTVSSIDEKRYSVLTVSGLPF